MSIFQEGSYSLTLSCSNCSQTHSYTIAKGTSYDKVKCLYCGCKDLTKSLRLGS